jgi:hypothetical protein
MTQNCQTLVRNPILAPCVCADGWICFFGGFVGITAMIFLRVLKLNAFLPPSFGAAFIRD